GSRTEPGSHRSVGRQAAALRKQAHDGSGGFFNRASGDLDARPVVTRTQFSGKCYLLRYCLAVNVLVAVLMGSSSKQPILADLNDTFGTGIETDDQRLLELLDMTGNCNSRNQRYISRFHTPVGKIDRGWRLRCSRHADEHHVCFLQSFEMLAIIMQHRVVKRINALEVLGIENVLRAYAM